MVLLQTSEQLIVDPGVIRRKKKKAPPPPNPFTGMEPSTYKKKSNLKQKKELKKGGLLRLLLT